MDDVPNRLPVAASVIPAIPASGENAQITGQEKGRGRGTALTSEPEPDELWKAPADQLLTKLSTRVEGLQAAEVRARLVVYGTNDAAAVKRSPRWLQFLARFRNPLVITLLVASGLSAATGDVASFVIVMSIVTISMTLDFV